jgi:uncharacterized membrane protein YhaH (DUF805 family)
MYTFIRGTLSSSEGLPFLYTNSLLLFEAIPIGFFLLIYCDRNINFHNNKSSIDNIINLFLWTNIFASIISLYLLINPEKNFFLNNYILRSEESIETSTIRGFGFSSGLTYAFSIVQGIAAAILLLKIIHDKPAKIPLYILGFILLFVSIILNARVGIIPIFIVTVYLIFVKRKISIILYGLGLVWLISFILFDTQAFAYFENNLGWSTQFFSETYDYFIRNNSDNTYGTLLGSMLFLPNSLSELLFGTGYNIFINYKRTTDVGYIIQLFFGGLSYLILLFSLVFIMAKRLYDLRKFNWFLFLFIFTVLICNIKGNFVSSNPAFRFLFLIYMDIIFFNSIEPTLDN